MKSSSKMLRALYSAAAIGIVVIQTSGMAVAQPSYSAGSSDPYQQQYPSLANHNIFVRERASSGPAPRGGSVSLPPQQAWVVTGIVSRDHQEYVVVENIQNGLVQQLHKGDRLAGGTVTDIAIESMSFTPDSREGAINVRVGANLTGVSGDSSTTTGNRRFSLSSATQPAPVRRNVNPGDSRGR